MIARSADTARLRLPRQRLTDWISWTVMSWVVPKVPFGRVPFSPLDPSQLIAQVMVALSLYVPPLDERR